MRLRIDRAPPRGTFDCQGGCEPKGDRVDGRQIRASRSIPGPRALFRTPARSSSPRRCSTSRIRFFAVETGGERGAGPSVPRRPAPPGRAAQVGRGARVRDAPRCGRKTLFERPRRRQRIRGMTLVGYSFKRNGVSFGGHGAAWWRTDVNQRGLRRADRRGLCAGVTGLRARRASRAASERGDLKRKLDALSAHPRPPIPPKDRAVAVRRRSWRRA